MRGSAGFLQEVVYQQRNQYFPVKLILFYCLQYSSIQASGLVSLRMKPVLTTPQLNGHYFTHRNSALSHPSPPLSSTSVAAIRPSLHIILRVRLSLPRLRLAPEPAGQCGPRKRRINIRWTSIDGDKKSLMRHNLQSLSRSNSIPSVQDD